MQRIFGKCYLRWSRRDTVNPILLIRKLSPKEVKEHPYINSSTLVSHFQVCLKHHLWAKRFLAHGNQTFSELVISFLCFLISLFIIYIKEVCLMCRKSYHLHKERRFSLNSLSLPISKFLHGTIWWKTCCHSNGQTYKRGPGWRDVVMSGAGILCHTWVSKHQHFTGEGLGGMNQWERKEGSIAACFVLSKLQWAHSTTVTFRCKIKIEKKKCTDSLPSTHIPKREEGWARISFSNYSTTVHCFLRIKQRF